MASYDFEPPSDATAMESTKRRFLSKKRMFGVVILGVTVFAWQRFPREVACWYYAAYEDHQLDGDNAKARRAIRQAIEWDPENVDYWFASGSTAMNTADYQRSWQDFDHARHLVETNHPHADRDIASAQNGAAYARALAGVELDRASADIAAALKASPHESSFIDTSGYIHYLLGDLETALDETNTAVKQAQSTYGLRKMAIRNVLQNSIRRRTLKLSLRQLNDELAELHLHRGLVYQKLGQDDVAERDFAHAKMYREKDS